MYPYEKFIVEKLPRLSRHIMREAISRDEINQCRKKAGRFLAETCSAVLGYPADIHLTEDSSSCARTVPTVFDSAFILDIIVDLETVSPRITSTLSSIILEHRRESGFWNFMLNVEDVSAHMCPDDIDDTSICVMSLYRAGKLSESKCRDIARKMLDSLKTNEKGEMSAWLHTEDTENRIMYKSLVGKVIIDIGSISNTLWFLASFGMDSDVRVLPSVKLIEDFINQLTINNWSDKESDGMVYYSNKFVILFLLSRYYKASNRMCKKLMELVKAELLDIELTQATPALNLALIVLAGINLNIHKVNQESRIENCDDLSKVVKKMLRIGEYLPTTQNDDGSFDPWMVYHWYRAGEYGGSKPISTAVVLLAISKMEKEVSQITTGE